MSDYLIGLMPGPHGERVDLPPPPMPPRRKRNRSTVALVVAVVALAVALGVTVGILVAGGDGVELAADSTDATAPSAFTSPVAAAVSAFPNARVYEVAGRTVRITLRASDVTSQRDYLRDFLDKLGFDAEAVIFRMSETRALDGTLTATSSSGVVATWTYHPDAGLGVVVSPP